MREDAVWIIQARCQARLTFSVELITPGLSVVLVLLFVEPAEESILEIKSLMAEIECVCMCPDVVIVIQFVSQDVVDHRVEKRSISTRTNARVHVGCRGRACESRIDMDERRPIVLGLSNPFEGHGMVLCDVAALHENRSAVLQIDPVIGHGSAAECCPQTGDGGAVSKSGLVLDVGCAKQTRCFLEEIALFLRVLRATHE